MNKRKKRNKQIVWLGRGWERLCYRRPPWNEFLLSKQFQIQNCTRNVPKQNSFEISGSYKQRHFYTERFKNEFATLHNIYS